MYQAACNVLKYMEGKTLQDLNQDSLLFFGVVKNIEIIGEAGYRLTNEFRENHPELPWREIIGMRHVLVHDYYQISPQLIYEVCSKDLPQLKSQLQGIIEKENI